MGFIHTTLLRWMTIVICLIGVSQFSKATKASSSVEPKHVHTQKTKKTASVKMQRELASEEIPHEVKLARIYQGYAVTWVKSHKNTWRRLLNGEESFHVEFFERLSDARHFIKEQFPSHSSAVSFALRTNTLKIHLASYSDRHILRWNSSDVGDEMQLSFKDRDEAEFFREHFEHGRYTRSNFGHAILFTR